jgi:hypothetical protein
VKLPGLKIIKTFSYRTRRRNLDKSNVPDYKKANLFIAEITTPMNIELQEELNRPVIGRPRNVLVGALVNDTPLEGPREKRRYNKKAKTVPPSGRVLRNKK